MSLRNVTRSRRGYMDELFGDAFDIVLQWMAVIRVTVTQAIRKEICMLRLVAGMEITAAGQEFVYRIKLHSSLRRELQFVRRILGGGPSNWVGAGRRTNPLLPRYYGPGYGSGRPPAILG